jgi:DNA-binding NarL/FixJ family response regulator
LRLIAGKKRRDARQGADSMNRELGARKAKYRVFLVDDHPIVRHGLTQLISREPDLMVCGESEDGSKGLAAVEAAKPDLVVVDLTLKRSSGFSLIKNLSALDPKLAILVLTIHEESLYAERCLRAGAKGYLMKEEAMENVLVAIRRILAGQVYLSDAMQSKLFRSSGKKNTAAIASPLERLSDRELEIFRLLGQGVGTRQIAELLHLSISTVESHRARIKEKLGIGSATELLQHAVKWVETESWG